MDNTSIKKRILIADDDPAIVDSLTVILEEFGYDVNSTGDGRQVYRIKNDLPDLLLLDIWMSGIDGRQICNDLKRENVTKGVPIILISAGRDIKKSANESGADDYLEKPFTMDDLLKKVEKWTGTKN